MQITEALVIKQYKNPKGLLVQLAKHCISHNYHRTDNNDGGWYYFTENDFEAMNNAFTGEHPMGIDGGYMFLEKDGGQEGMIRLEDDQGCNPKWDFWVHEGKVRVEEC
jgi:hypothetical protein